MEVWLLNPITVFFPFTSRLQRLNTSDCYANLFIIFFNLAYSSKHFHQKGYNIDSRRDHQTVLSNNDTMTLENSFIQKKIYKWLCYTWKFETRYGVMMQKKKKKHLKLKERHNAMFAFCTNKCGRKFEYCVSDTLDEGKIFRQILIMNAVITIQVRPMSKKRCEESSFWKRCNR